jgi:hypothetical protein
MLRGDLLTVACQNFGLAAAASYGTQNHSLHVAGGRARRRGARESDRDLGADGPEVLAQKKLRRAERCGPHLVREGRRNLRGPPLPPLSSAANTAGQRHTQSGTALRIGCHGLEVDGHAHL